MLGHYALLYGFHTLPNMLIKPLREACGFVYVSTYSGAYGSHAIGHSVGPLVLTTVYRQVTGHFKHLKFLGL